MKSAIVVLLISISSASAFACLGEAQFIARVGSIEKTMTSCKAFLDLNTVRYYSENLVCPLDLAEVHESGIQVGLMNGHDCKVEVGEEISGVIVKSANGTLTIE